jgi:hypothetical protein
MRFYNDCVVIGDVIWWLKYICDGYISMGSVGIMSENRLCRLCRIVE